MGKKPREKMSVSQRAKQFAPFQSVGGLEEALARAEEEHRRRMEQNTYRHEETEDEEK